MVQSIKIHLKSYRIELIEKSFFIIEYLVINSFLLNNINRLKFHVKKKEKKDFTVIRSPHVHKKSREQFGLTIHHWVFSLEGQKILPLLNLLKMCSFDGVQIKISLKSNTYFWENYQNT